MSIPCFIAVSLRTCPLLEPGMPGYLDSMDQFILVSDGQFLKMSIAVGMSQCMLISDGECDFTLPHSFQSIVVDSSLNTKIQMLRYHPGFVLE